MSGIRAALGALNTIETKRSNIAREEIARSDIELRREQAEAAIQAQTGKTFKENMAASQQSFEENLNLITQRLKTGEDLGDPEFQAAMNLLEKQAALHDNSFVTQANRAGLPPGQSMTNRLQIARGALVTELQEARSKGSSSAEEGFSKVEAFNERFGGDTSSELARTSARTAGVKIREISEVEDLNEQLNVARAQGDEQLAAFLEGRLEKLSTTVGRTEFDDPARLSDKDREKAAKEFSDVSDELANIAVTLDEVERIGRGTTGLRGLAAEKVGGVVGQVFGKGAEEGVSRAITGVSVAESKRIRTRLRTLTAQMLSEITGEESGRFTEPERRLAETTLGSLEPEASDTQIRSALVTVMQLKVVSRDRARSQAGIPSEFDLGTREGYNAMGADLQSKLGMTDSEVVQLLDQLRLSRELRRNEVNVE